jgi:O-antigen ligase
MSILALIISFLFSGTLIVRDCMRRRTVSSAVWVPTVLLMIIGSRAPSEWLSGGYARQAVENANNLAGNMVDQVFYLCIIVLSLLAAFWHRLNWRKLFGANTAIMLFYAYFAISIFWSSDPSGSAKRIFKDFGLFLAVGVIFAEDDPLQAIRAVYARCAYVLLPLSVVFIKYFPSYGRNYSYGGSMNFTGVTTQKNGLGEIVMIFTLVLIWDYLERCPKGQRLKLSRIPWEIVITLLIGIWLLRLSQSKTALVCTVIGIFLMSRSGLLMSKATNRVILVGALCLPILILFSLQFTEVITPVLQALGRDATFTGRTDIWQHINLKTVNPVLGAGYYNFWGGPGGDTINRAMDSLIPNAHNGYLDMYLDGGFVGIFFLFLMLLTSGLRIARYLKSGGTLSQLDRYQRIRFALLIVAIIYNLSESIFARIGTTWFTTLLVMADYRSIKPAAKIAGNSSARRPNSRIAYQAPKLVNQ